METLEHAYKSALAVLTAPVSFVEWTTLKVESLATPDPRITNDWCPIGLSMGYGGDDYEWDAARKIEGEPYIYVFSRRLWSSDVPTLVEELRLASDGTIFAAQLGTRRFPDARPLDGRDSPLPEKREWKKIGATMRFVRRLRGSRMAHYFFASRIPLSRRFVEELRKNVALWVPETQFDDGAYVLTSTSDPNVPSPTTFGEWDQNLVTGLGPGALQVAVLDPITIALHLHDLATSATDDVLDYATIYDGQNAKRREQVVKRQQKLMLAYVVQMVLKNYDTGTYGAQHDVSVRTSKFIEQYWEQINYRIGQRERWWTYLGNWYQSDPIHFLARAHMEHPDQHWISFLLPMLLCLLNANGSKAGREMLQAIVKGKKHFDWLHRQVLPEMEHEEEDTKAATYQVPRKFALAILEAVKELGPHFLDDSTQKMWRVLGAHSTRFNFRFMIDGAPMDANPLKAAEKFERSQRKLGFDVPKAHEIVEEWHELAEHGYKGTVLKLTAVVELIDLTLSVRQFVNHRSLDHGLTLVRSMADTSALLLEFAHDAKGKVLRKLFATRPAIIGIAGIIEGYLSIQETRHSAHKHDGVGVAAGVITTGGAAIQTLGVIGMVGLDLSFTPFFIAGLILMGIGAIISLFKDSPMETFLKHCAFGRDGGGGEIVEGLEAMKEGEYGQQLEVLLNLLCRFKFDRADVASLDVGERTNDARRARVTMGWVPDGAVLHVDYHDVWRLGPEHFRSMTSQVGYPWSEAGGDKLTKEITFGDGGPSLTKERQIDLMFSKAPAFSALSNDYDFKANFSAQLRVAFGDYKFVIPPKPYDFKIGIMMY